MGVFAWQGPAGGGGSSLPTGVEGQFLGYGPGGAPVAVSLPTGFDSLPWADVTDKPAAFPPSAHTHPWGELTGVPSSFTPSAHTHVIGDMTGMQAALDEKASTDHGHAWADITDPPATYPPSTHSHAVADVTGLQTALDALTGRQNNWIGTQAEYDALPQAQRDDPAITYLVTS